ncbi:MAG: hypothetical protein KKE37_11145 [Verrucomicrobia bacterium]|nr:hypothetical protein [Verrucomicrobiota bacterium]MBU4291024.1 hypothetical protein [Verrucomicrobiota bacterium]MBU4429893.1 hypothetical protein [Verrucomicrobiota bacterium]MCG2678914.1 hypothetical protein [Kiritimatiellia bacterium]
MNHPFILIGCLLLGTTWGLAATTGGPEFNRYQVILDRKPFGEIIPAETAATTSAPTETLTRELEMRAIIDDGNNTLRVGFLDKKTKKTFYLGVGETNETYELVSVNYDDEEAMLKKGMETTIFTLKPNKTPAGPSGPGLAPGPIPGAPVRTLGTTPSQGFIPTPLTDTKKPFFSDLKKRKFSPFRPLGTNAPVPFQTQSIESFMKANPNTAQGFPGQVRPFEPVNKTDSKGNTIDGFLRANPDAASQFAPLKPPDPNVKTEGQGSTLQGFLTPQTQPAATPTELPNVEDPGETSEE